MKKPTLVITHNKTLAAQLYFEFKELFPNNAVHYFVSYYDYYQPEAYIPQRDIYIEKDSDINDDIDRLRLAATSALLWRRDVIVVASVSCIYGLGSPEAYYGMLLPLELGQRIDRDQILRKLVENGFVRTDLVGEDADRPAGLVDGGVAERDELAVDEVEDGLARRPALVGRVAATLDLEVEDELVGLAEVVDGPLWQAARRSTSP